MRESGRESRQRKRESVIETEKDREIKRDRVTE